MKEEERDEVDIDPRFHASPYREILITCTIHLWQLLPHSLIVIK